MYTNQEKNLIFYDRGGGSIGKIAGMYIHGTWPFAKLFIYGDKMVISVMSYKVELKLSDITDVKRIRIIPYIADGVKIIHQRNDIPGHLVFWSLGGAGQIYNILKARIANRPA